MLIATLFIVAPVFATKRVAILETVDREGRVAYGVKLMIRNKLSAVITATPGYEGYDRVDVASIMQEHDFQRTGMVSDADVKKLGEMTGANYVLVAEAAYLNSSNIYLVAKILNVETAKIEQTADVQTQTTVEDLEKSCRLLAGKLLNVNVATGAVRGELTIGDSRYIGEHKNGKPHGNGVKYYGEKTKLKLYKGAWVYGRREGTGTLIWKDGSKYEGEWKEGRRNGYGTMYYKNGNIYRGNWLNDKRHGTGKMDFAANDSVNRTYYEGDWVEGVRQGVGTMKWNNGDKYSGGWKNNGRYGQGVCYYADGDREKAYWDENENRSGQAIFYYKDGSYIKGSYVDDKRDGHWRKYRNGKYICTWVYHNGRLGRTIWP